MTLTAAEIERLRLYWRLYCAELAKYTTGSRADDLRSKEKTDVNFDWLLAENEIDFKTLRDFAGGIIGFLATVEYNNVLFILEAFVVPACRRLGIMRRAINEKITPQIKKVVFAVYDGNPALRCWAQLMDEHGFAEESRATIDGLTEYEFARGRE